MKLYWYSAGWIIGLTFFSGCFVTEEYSSYRALQRDGPSHIRVMTRDTVLYALSDFHVLDSTLQGEGTREVHGKSEAFNGIIPLGEVVYVQGRDFSFIRTLLAGFTLGDHGA